MQAAPVLETPCYLGNLADAAEAVIRRAISGLGGHACLANAHVLVTARREPRLRQALADAWCVFPDGAPVAWMLRRTVGGSDRIAGPDLMPLVIDRGRAYGLRHFLFGSSEKVLVELERRLATRYPGAAIAGRHAPPFGDIHGSALDRIRDARPDVVWCALGAPKQERWMHRHAADLAPALLIGVGAAFDFLSGTKPRAPEWMQRAGLEWLHRLAMEPLRLAPRYVGTNGAFLAFAIRTLVIGGRRKVGDA